MDRLPVWIHLKHVPLELFTRGGLSYIASALGNPLMARELLLQLKFPGCLRNVVIVTITNEGDMMKSQLKTIATSSNSPDSTRNFMEVTLGVKEKDFGSIWKMLRKVLKDSFLARKLDRVLANDVWLSRFLRAPGAKPFRFSNFWAKYPDFMKTVEQSWKEPVDGDPMFRLMKQSRQPIKLLT
ncbi:hypothetical protein GOBAR_AA37058 [Gossypium barbadense]|uniref:DUF4283 domain-containing protein n=1 Tax=Gossypium barbadense TaxID=3634 RepID=A0A2P5VXS9_GOSBA|nr:hypothetical protein GOBAR_AA37058 [Gossypium barbadense]